MTLDSYGKIAPTTGVPMHLQLERILRERIRAMRPGDRLPTEKELREHYGLSSSTVRQALQSLVNQGLVCRKVAKGTFVAPQPIEEQLSELLGFSQMARQMGMEPGGRLIESGFTPASADVASALRLPIGEDVLRVVRVRYANGEPVCVETTFFRKEIGVLLVAEDLSAVAFYPTLESRYGIKLVAARETIGASLATPSDAGLLSIPRRFPVLTVERVTYVPEGVASEFARHVYRADRYRYGVWRRRNLRAHVVAVDETLLSNGGPGQ